MEDGDFSQVKKLKDYGMDEKWNGLFKVSGLCGCGCGCVRASL